MNIKYHNTEKYLSEAKHFLNHYKCYIKVVQKFLDNTINKKSIFLTPTKGWISTNFNIKYKDQRTLD